MQILTSHLKAALLAAAKKDIRYYFVGVLIDQHNIVGCDGSRLHVTPHGGEWPWDPVIIPRQTIELALKLKLKTLEVSPTTLGSLTYAPVDGKFPDYKRVMMPSGASVAHGPIEANIVPSQLVDATEAVRLVTGMSLASLSFVNSSWVWSNRQIQVVLMPTRPTKAVHQLTSLEF